MQQFNPGDIISFPSLEKMSFLVDANKIYYASAKVSKRKTVKIKKFLGLRDISISFNLPAKRTNMPVVSLKRK